MDKIPLMESLDEQLRPEERIFKYRSSLLIGKVLNIDLLVNHAVYDAKLNADLKNKVISVFKREIPDGISLNVNYIKTDTEKESLIRKILDYIYRENSMLYDAFLTAPVETVIEEDLVTVNITLERYLYEFAMISGLNEKLEEYMNRQIMENCKINFLPTENQKTFSGSKPRQTSVNPFRYVDISINNFYNGAISQRPRYISDVADKEYRKVVLCGKISNLNCRYIEKITKNLYSFYLNDTTGQIKVKFFAGRIKKGNWEEIFRDGETFVVEGQIKVDSFEGGCVLFANVIAGCEINYDSIDLKSNFLPVPDNYVNVFPRSLNIQKQILTTDREMFDEEFLKEKYSVVDFEIAGDDLLNDEICAISAIRIENGAAVETFDCVLKTDGERGEIDERRALDKGINCREMGGYFRFKDIIADLYKFCSESVLILRDADETFSRLRSAGKKYNYDFDNSRLDFVGSIRRRVPCKSGKLADLCKRFDIPLDAEARLCDKVSAMAGVFLSSMRKTEKNA